MRRKKVAYSAMRFFAGLRNEITYDAVWNNYSQELRYDVSSDPETPEFCNLLLQLLQDERLNIAAAIQTLVNAKHIDYEYPSFQLYALMCRVEAMEARMKHESMTVDSEYNMLIFLKKILTAELQKHVNSPAP